MTEYYSPALVKFHRTWTSPPWAQPGAAGRAGQRLRSSLVPGPQRGTELDSARHGRGETTGMPAKAQRRACQQDSECHSRYMPWDCPKAAAQHRRRSTQVARLVQPLPVSQALPVQPALWTPHEASGPEASDCASLRSLATFPPVTCAGCFLNTPLGRQQKFTDT